MFCSLVRVMLPLLLVLMGASAIAHGHHGSADDVHHCVLCYLSSAPVDLPGDSSGLVVTALVQTSTSRVHPAETHAVQTTPAHSTHQLRGPPAA